MGFSFYPGHEHNCPNVSHCPHLGGAALGTLVLLANEQELSQRALHATIDAERARNVIGISYRKIPQAIEELFGITFTPAALIGFETMLAEKAKPIVDDIAKKLGSSDGAVHADETYWTLNGDRAYYWVHCDAGFAHFQFDTSRSGQVSRDVLGEAQQVTEKIWLRERLAQLITFPVSHEKALRLQKRILKHQHEWLVFLDDPRVPPTNNTAERALRPLVVLRKITFGHRSEAGAVQMARLMTVAETAKRHGHRPSDIYFRLFTQPPGRVLRQLYNDS